MRLWEEREDLKINSLRNYLYTCTKHYILNRIRRIDNERRHSICIAIQNSGFEVSPEEELERQEDAGFLRRAIDALPPQQNLVLSLKRDGLSNAEIAGKLGISVSTVKFHYSQLLNTLRRKLK